MAPLKVGIMDQIRVSKLSMKTVHSSVSEKTFHNFKGKPTLQMKTLSKQSHL